MKNKKIISLAALALTASLFLGACGGNKIHYDIPPWQVHNAYIQHVGEPEQPDDFLRIQDLLYLCLARWKWFVLSLAINQ